MTPLRSKSVRALCALALSAAVAAGAALLPGVSRADDATTPLAPSPRGDGRPEARGSDPKGNDSRGQGPDFRGDGRGPEHRDGFRGGPRPSAQPPKPIDPEQWNKAVAFMTEQSPRRWKITAGHIAEMGAGSKADFFRRGIIERYEELKRLESQDPPLYLLAVQRAKLEDVIFGDCWDIAEARRAGSDDSSLREKLSTHVGQLYDVRSEERQLKITRLKDEQARIASDLSKLEDEQDRFSNRETYVRERTESFSRFGFRGYGSRPDGSRPDSRPDFRQGNRPDGRDNPSRNRPEGRPPTTKPDTSAAPATPE